MDRLKIISLVFLIVCSSFVFSVDYYMHGQNESSGEWIPILVSSSGQLKTEMNLSEAENLTCDDCISGGQLADVINLDGDFKIGNLFIGNSGFIGIGNVNPGVELNVTGVIDASQLMVNGSVVETSSFDATSLWNDIYSNSTDQLNLWNDVYANSTERLNDNTTLTAMINERDPDANLTGGGSQNYLSKFSDALVLTNSIVYDTGAFIGILTTTPTHELTVQGSTNITGSLYVGGVPITGGSGEAANVTSNGTANYITKFLNSTNLGNSILYEISNKIGIGKLNPLAILDIEQSPVGDLELNVSGVLVVNGTSGWVGIGKGSPSQALTVTGDGNITGDLYVGNITMGEDELTNTGGELYWKGAPISTAGGWTNVTVFTSNGTFTVPDGVTHIYVEVWGAGGGGLAYSNSNYYGAGGAGGGYAAELIKVTEGTVVSCVVGVGGTGGPGAIGVNGTYSAFGNYLNATGGRGGITSYQKTNLGGMGYGGDINLEGEDSTSRVYVAGEGGSAAGAGGGQGGSGGSGSGAGFAMNGTTPGGGGGGNANALVAGYGARGEVRVWWNDGSMNSVRTISSSIWNKTAANVFLGDGDDQVGIGTDSPTSKLNVVGNVNVTGNLTVEGYKIECPTGFTSIEGGGKQFGCMQTAEDGTANWYAAMYNCLDSYGGRLPSVQEWYLAMNVSSLTDETDDYEWTSETSYLSSTQYAMEIGSGSITAWARVGPATALAYRCWIPVTS